ncbi:MAG: HAMP domain-containing sensor histidine kinase [Longimicrobiales bacterium]|nr:HAMP domain-containing sensor histidine kinase [Longimicrobiales bacterium]
MTAIWIVGIVIALVAGWLLGSRRTPPDRYDAPLTELVTELDAGAIRGPEAEDPEGIARIRRSVNQHWVPLNESRSEALDQALGRIAAFIEESIHKPLQAVRDGDADLLREGVGRALGGITDLEFFLRDPITPDETHNLTPLIQQVTREFIEDWEVGVRLTAQQFPVRAHIHRDTFMDAVYLLLHNAVHFGAGKTIEVRIEERDGRAVIEILDRGPGFSAEALDRARDLFYTTRESALGLGIPFARKIVEGFGGNLELENRPEGGARVRLTLPGA